MPHLCDPKDCMGCSVCSNTCPKNCISMVVDDEGFVYPEVEEERCISCGLCEKSCPVLNRKSAVTMTKAYAAVNPDQVTRNTSTSGGVFSLLAQTVLRKNGVVFGAAYNPDFSVSHQYTETEDGLQRFRGAKYVQSDIGNSYQQVKSFLNENRYVLFSGTPCQIAGLQTYLGKDYDKLFCVDLICHGIPSPEVWQHNIDYRAKIDNDGVRPAHINMRSKSTGWQRYSVEFQYSDKTYSKMYADDPYMWGYIKDLYTRPSCFDCKFKGLQRNSDFTLGDYWGIESQHPEMNDGMGTSLVFVHSEKAQNIWSELCLGLHCREVDAAAAVQWNPMAVQSTSYQERREEFFRRYQNEDFSKLVWELIPKPVPQKCSIFRRILNKAKRALKRQTT